MFSYTDHCVVSLIIEVSIIGFHPASIQDKILCYTFLFTLEMYQLIYMVGTFKWWKIFLAQPLKMYWPIFEESQSQHIKFYYPHLFSKYNSTSFPKFILLTIVCSPHLNTILDVVEYPIYNIWPVCCVSGATLYDLLNSRPISCQEILY